MKHLITSTSLLFIFPVLTWNCNNSRSSRLDNEFALYSTGEVKDSVNDFYKIVPIVDHYITIPNDYDLLKTINVLLDSVSQNSFNNQKIEVLLIEEKENGSILLIINLSEHENFVIPDSLGHYRTWYDFFQGTLGGEATGIILKESILQRNYKGRWIDELQVYYQNEPFGDRDHIQLSGSIMR